MRLLNLPLPIFAAILAPQVEPPGMSPMPAWVAAIAAWIFVLGWFLQQWGKLPGVSGERRSTCFCDEDRRKLTEMHGIVTAEDDNLPRWRRVWSPTKETLETLELVHELAALRLAWEAERKEWQAERSRLESRITHLEEINRMQEHALGARG
jgi:hypothetical protein